MSKQNYISIEDGPEEKEATIDFFDFRRGDNLIEEISVKVKLEYNPNKGTAELRVYATQGEYATILIDEWKEVNVTSCEDEDEVD